MTNKQLAQFFATTAFSSAHANSMFVKGNVIYSYGEHFPIALRSFDNTAYFNTDKYSKTTSTHQGLVKRALLSEGYTLIEKTTEQLKELI